MNLLSYLVYFLLLALENNLNYFHVFLFPVAKQLCRPEELVCICKCSEQSAPLFSFVWCLICLYTFFGVRESENNQWELIGKTVLADKTNTVYIQEDCIHEKQRYRASERII